nr:Transcription termination factor like [Ipomoea batatas]
MFNFMAKMLPHLRYSVNRYSPTQSFYFLHFAPLSSSSKAVKSYSGNAKNGDSFTVSYLINKCSFTPERALSASKYTKIEEAGKPDAVLLFLKNQGFTKPQISNIVKRVPPVLLCDPQKTLLPKIEFLKSSGFTLEQLTAILNASPSTFRRSLKNQVVPTFNFLNNFIGSTEKIVYVARRYTHIFGVDVEASMGPNIQLLKDVGVPESKIIQFLINQPRAFVIDKERFRGIVEEVEGMGFNPLRFKFLVAVNAFRAMSKETWEKKIEAYKKCGFSEAEILKAFKDNPRCILVSTRKILAVMDFLFNKMGFKRSMFLNRPVIISLSLEKRVIPRCLVYQDLLAKGLINERLRLVSMLEASEKKFLEKYIARHGKEAPHLLKVLLPEFPSPIRAGNLILKGRGAIAIPSIADFNCNLDCLLLLFVSLNQLGPLRDWAMKHGFEDGFELASEFLGADLTLESFLSEYPFLAVLDMARLLALYDPFNPAGLHQSLHHRQCSLQIVVIDLHSDSAALLELPTH